MQGENLVVTDDLRFYSQGVQTHWSLENSIFSKHLTLFSMFCANIINQSDPILKYCWSRIGNHLNVFQQSGEEQRAEAIREGGVGERAGPQHPADFPELICHSMLPLSCHRDLQPQTLPLEAIYTPRQDKTVI